MEKSIAEALTHTLIKRSPVFIDQEALQHLTVALTALEIQDKSKIAIPLPPSLRESPLASASQSGSLDDSFHYLWLSRIIDNRNLVEYTPDPATRVIEGALRALGRYGSTDIINAIASDSELKYVIKKSGSPYSLLAKVNQIDTGKSGLFSSETEYRTPLLVVPGIGKADLELIAAWEEAHTVKS